jgi:chromosome segregation ATPase
MRSQYEARLAALESELLKTAEELGRYKAGTGDITQLHQKDLDIIQLQTQLTSAKETESRLLEERKQMMELYQQSSQQRSSAGYSASDQQQQWQAQSALQHQWSDERDALVRRIRDEELRATQLAVEVSNLQQQLHSQPKTPEMAQFLVSFHYFI